MSVVEQVEVPSDTKLDEITTTKQLMDTDDLDIKSEEADLIEENPEELIANAMSGDKLKELLSANGPTVKAVLLKTDGSAEQIMYDSTPSKNHVTQILGAPPSIIGQYADLDLIIVGPRCKQSPAEFAKNTHKLRYPFNNEEFYGDIFLYRFSQDCVVEDFLLSEYEEFASKASEDIGKVFKPMISDNSEAHDDDEYDEEIDEEEAAQFTQDFMRDIIMKKVKAEFPAKFGREPTDEELESYIAGTMQAAGALFGGFGGDIDEEAEFEDDEEYDPNDDAADEEEEEDVANEEELAEAKKDILSHQQMEQMEPTDVNEEDEAKMVNSESFQNELLEAIDQVKSVAHFDRNRILALAREQYIRDTGDNPTDEMLQNALNMFAEVDESDNDVHEEASEDEEDEVDVALFAKQMEEALAHVREVGAAHGKEFEQKVLSDAFMTMNGVEPTQEQLNGIKRRIKDKFQEEARDEFLDGVESEEHQSDEQDGDYEPNEEEKQQIVDDHKMDAMEEMMEEKAVEKSVSVPVVSGQKRKVLVTPVKKRRSGAAMGVYIDEQSDAKKTLEFASSKFEQINKKAPTDDDKERLKAFLSPGLLFEAEMNDVPFDEEEDEEYCPEKDENNYEQDAVDQEEFERDFAKMTVDMDANENEDTSNMIDID